MYREEGICVKLLEMKRTLFFIESLSGGGAEKVLITLLSHFDYDRCDVEVLTVSDVGLYKKDLEMILSQNSSHLVYRTICGDGKSLWQKILYKLIYHFLPAWIVSAFFIPSGYDTYVAFVEGFCTKVLSCVKRRKIAWVHTDLLVYPWPLDNKIYKTLGEEKVAYKSYDQVVCVSHSVEGAMRNHYGLDNVLTIHNPVDVGAIKRDADAFMVSKKETFNLISVGRLVKQKGYDLLIPLISKLRALSLNVCLDILGEGEERAHLEGIIKKEQLTDVVHLLGYVNNPYPYVKNADLFVCSSRVEGYSLVVAEALVLGTPVISMRCSGPEELLGYGKYGLLCDDYEQLENKIAQVIEDRNKYEELKHMAEDGMATYDIGQTMSRIYEIL